MLVINYCSLGTVDSYPHNCTLKRSPCWQNLKFRTKKRRKKKLKLESVNRAADPRGSNKSKQRFFIKSAEKEKVVVEDEEEVKTTTNSIKNSLIWATRHPQN